MTTFLVSLLFILPLLAFYLWMFRDLANNDTLTRGTVYLAVGVFAPERLRRGRP